MRKPILITGALVPFCILAFVAHSYRNGGKFDACRSSQFPLPLYHDRPDDFWFFGESEVRATGDCRSGFEYIFANCDSVSVAIGTADEPFNAYYARVISKTDTILVQLVAGTTCGVIGEWYLGEGLIATIDLRAPLPHCRVGFEWHVFESACHALKIDLVTLRVIYGWKGDNVPTVLENTYIGLAFALAMTLAPYTATHSSELIP